MDYKRHLPAMREVQTIPKRCARPGLRLIGGWARVPNGNYDTGCVGMLFIFIFFLEPVRRSRWTL